MLESILYFLLGFLSSALLALMVSPAIWNRAVVLTKRRIESSVPLTLNEIQADKDQLRAEFAMSTRRLEMSVEDLREKASSQIIDINRKRDDLNRLAEESAEKVRTIEMLEATASDLRAQLKNRETELEDAAERYDMLQQKLEEKTLELEQLRARLSSVQTESDSRRIELVAKQTAVQNLNDQVSDFRRKDSELLEEIRNKEREVAKFKTQLDNAERRRDENEQRLSRLQEQLADAQERLERRERDIARMREASGSDAGTNSELTREIMDERARTVELEAKLAQANLQMEALLNDASNDNVEKAIASLNAENRETIDKLESVSMERDELKKALNAIERDKTTDWDEERRENAILRERINDLAAQVTAMTASLEGDGSPIAEILANSAKTGKSGSSSKGAPENLTLADRIRALQDQVKAANQ